MSFKAFGEAAAHTAGSQLASQVLQTPQGQQALARSAKEIACGSAALVGSATVLAAVAAPAVAVGAAGLGLLYATGKVLDWLID